MSAIHFPYTRNCFVCGAENTHGLRLRFRWETDAVRADFLPRAPHEGYPGVVHGGVIASALDETMFWAAAYASREFHVSVEMAVRYQEKVTVGHSYFLLARTVREQRHICFTEAELRDAAGKVCATATGKFFPLRPNAVPIRHEDFVTDPGTVSVADFWPRTGVA
jgi:acyl-coenzyme A thioesterase PaaI-like protein